MKPKFSPSFSAPLAVLATALLAAPCADAATLLDLGSLVRPPETGANTFILGTGNALPTTFSENPLVPSVAFTSQFGYLVAQFDAVTLSNIGDSITFSYTAKFTNFDTTSNGVRIGLLNSAESALSADGSTTNVGPANLYTGYIGRYRATSTAQGAILRRMEGATPQLLGGTALSGPVLSDSVSGFGITDQSLYYSGSLSVVRTGPNEVTIVSQFGDQSATTAIDSTAGFVTTFNTLALYTNRSGNTTATVLEFTEFSITSIPEPESAALIFGGVGLLAWRLRSRRRLTAAVSGG